MANLSDLTAGQRTLRGIGRGNLIILVEYLEIERNKVRGRLEVTTEETFKIFQGKIQEIKDIERDIEAIEVNR